MSDVSDVPNMNRLRFWKTGKKSRSLPTKIVHTNIPPHRVLFASGRKLENCASSPTALIFIKRESFELKRNRFRFFSNLLNFFPEKIHRENEAETFFHVIYTVFTLSHKNVNKKEARFWGRFACFCQKSQNYHIYLLLSNEWSHLRLFRMRN